MNGWLIDELMLEDDGWMDGRKNGCMDGGLMYG